ncbi:MAG: lysostaphin resistance A-like protein [Phycisphaerae bacterium]
MATHLDQLFGFSQYLWLVVGIGLIIGLRVFRAAPLAAAPPRLGGISALTVAAAILLYCGTAFMTITAFALWNQAHAPPAATAPATFPATSPSTASAPASLPAATRPATTRHAPATRPRILYSESTSNILLSQLLNTFAEAVPALVLVILASRIVVGGLDGWGLSLRKLPKGVGYGILGFLALTPLLIIVANATEYIITHFEKRPEEVHETLQVLSRKPPLWEQTAFILLAGVAAPILEEIFFRGCFQTMLIQPRFGFSFQHPIDLNYRPTPARRWFAILLTSAFFASVHPIDHFAVIFLLALGLGYLYERTGNMWANITLHAAFNSFSIYFTLISGS